MIANVFENMEKYQIVNKRRGFYFSNVHQPIKKRLFTFF
ncbi:hypothetical protein C1O63_0536 [Dehalococcoides mccartyi]|nr:hypothetical protein C1O63_0536 [Dehalococcoides mccartyi]